jgi:hypothetical protein
MALLNRQSLINYFKKGSAPSERHFADLIESTVNIVDDGISREGENGFRITPIGRSKRLISFYKNFKQIHPEWSINLDKEQNGGLAFQEEEKKPVLVLKNGGNVGIDEENPKSKLDVNGVITSKGRVSSLLVGEVPGDGKWHTMIDGLKEPPTEHTILGNYVHSILEEFYRLEAGQRTLLNARDLFRAIWDDYAEDVTKIYRNNSQSIS